LERALDEGEPVVQSEWYAAPLDPQGAPGELLVAFREKVGWPDRGARLDPLRRWLGQALALARSRERDKRQIARLSTLLEIAAEWRQATEMNDLLARLAEASTKLLRAERASIFLWDRTAHALVGRPSTRRRGRRTANSRTPASLARSCRPDSRGASMPTCPSTSEI
jgi:hypothetical protein